MTVFALAVEAGRGFFAIAFGPSRLGWSLALEPLARLLDFVPTLVLIIQRITHRNSLTVHYWRRSQKSCVRAFWTGAGKPGSVSPPQKAN